MCILNLMKGAIWCLVNRFGSSLCFYHQACLTMPSSIQWCGSQLCSLPWLLFHHLWLHALLMSPSRPMTSTRWEMHITNVRKGFKVWMRLYIHLSLLGQLYVSFSVWLGDALTITIENLECWHIWLEFYHFFKAEFVVVTPPNHFPHSHLTAMQIHSSSPQHVELISNQRRGTSHHHSSYALSQGAGPRHLISSSICSTVPSVDEKVTRGYKPTESQGWICIMDNSSPPKGCLNND